MMTTINLSTITAVSPVVTFHLNGRPGLTAEELHEAFLAVAELGSTNRAADALYMSQSTVTRRMYVFEARLGVELFARQPGRPLALTAVGQAVLEKLQAMLAKGCLAVPIRVLVYRKCGHSWVEATDNVNLEFTDFGARIVTDVVYVCGECWRQYGRKQEMIIGDRFVYPVRK
jgi:hypothetical protein